MRGYEEALSRFSDWLLEMGYLDVVDGSNEFNGLVRHFLGSVGAPRTTGWLDASTNPPPKDGSLIILHYGRDYYAIVRWVERNDLTDGGGWFLAHGGPEGFLFGDEIKGVRWRPFVP